MATNRNKYHQKATNCNMPGSGMEACRSYQILESGLAPHGSESSQRGQLLSDHPRKLRVSYMWAVGGLLDNGPELVWDTCLTWYAQDSTGVPTLLINTSKY